MEALYIAGLNFGLSFLFFINTAFENDDMDGDGKPDGEECSDGVHCGEPSKIKRQLSKPKKEKKSLGEMIQKVPNLWFP